MISTRVTDGAVEYDSVEANRIKHLELIQAVISRLGNDSFLVKGWSITLAGAFLGFAVSAQDGVLALTASVPIAFFWVLDTFYLWSERMFRALYDSVRSGSPKTDPFFMAATSTAFRQALREDGAAVVTRKHIFASQTLVLFYGALLAGSLAFGALIGL